eukprot:10142719-Karenia_brevis.AAC.1
MSGERRSYRDELDGIHDYLSSQVDKLGKALDEDLDENENEVEEVEERCKARMEELQEQMGDTVGKAMTEMEQSRARA